MYRELVATKADPKPKHKSTSQIDPLGPARSAVHRRRTVRPASNVRDGPSSWPDRSLHHSQTFDQRRPPESLSADTSITAPPGFDRLSDYEILMGTSLAHAESSPRSTMDNRRPSLRNTPRYAESGRHLDESGDFSSHQPIRPLLGIPEVRYFIRGSETITQNARDLDPLLAVDSRSRRLHYIPASPYTFSNTSRRLPEIIAPRLSSRQSSVPDLLDESDETSSRYYMRLQDQFRSRSLRRLRRSFLDSHRSRDLIREEVDGLGDRRRSCTPEDYSWETLRTTITPDERLPSVDSSFASTGALSASDLTHSTATSLPTVGTSSVCSFLCDNSCSEESGIEN